MDSQGDPKDDFKVNDVVLILGHPKVKRAIQATRASYKSITIEKVKQAILIEGNMICILASHCFMHYFT